MKTLLMFESFVFFGIICSGMLLTQGAKIFQKTNNGAFPNTFGISLKKYWITHMVGITKVFEFGSSESFFGDCITKGLI